MVTATMVGLDAQIELPRVVSTFTTRDQVTPQMLRNATAYILKLVRVELGPVRCCSFLEFTTGQAARSGGVRRPHLHSLWKDVDPDDGPIIAGIAGHVLEEVTGSWRHDVEELRSPAGCVRYVASHHLKESQAPPKSWGPTRRVRPTKGYWSRPANEFREEAMAIVRDKRIRTRIWAIVDQAEEESGLDLTSWGADLIDDALSAPPPEVVKVREVAGRMVEVMGSVR